MGKAGRAQRSRGITAARRERMARALALREDGASFRAIAKTLGVSERQAWLDVNDALKEVTREPAEDVLKLELSRLDKLYVIAYQRALTKSDPRAIDSALRIMDRRAKYLGLDDVQTGHDVNEVRSLLDRLLDASPADDNPAA